MAIAQILVVLRHPKSQPKFTLFGVLANRVGKHNSHFSGGETEPQRSLMARGLTVVAAVVSTTPLPLPGPLSEETGF